MCEGKQSLILLQLSVKRATFLILLSLLIMIQLRCGRNIVNVDYVSPTMGENNFYVEEGGGQSMVVRIVIHLGKQAVAKWKVWDDGSPISTQQCFRLRIFRVSDFVSVKY